MFRLCLLFIHFLSPTNVLSKISPFFVFRPPPHPPYYIFQKFVYFFYLSLIFPKNLINFRRQISRRRAEIIYHCTSHIYYRSFNDNFKLKKPLWSQWSRPIQKYFGVVGLRVKYCKPYTCTGGPFDSCA